MLSNPQRTADVVVVGAGAIGLSVGCELRRLGAEVTIVEAKAGPGLGSTGRAMGGVRAQFSTVSNIRFSAFSIDALEQLASRHPDVLTFYQVGYLLFTADPAKADIMRATVDVQRSLGVESDFLLPEQVIDIAPYIRPDGILAGTFHARDGFLDPHAVTTALLRDFHSLGGTISTNVTVTDLKSDNGSAFTVSTTSGEMTADWVVNAAGPEAAEVAALAGADLAVTPVRRNLAFIADHKAPLIPMSVDLDTGVLIRREVGGGYVVAYADPSDPVTTDTTLDLTFLPKLSALIGNRFPFLECSPINSRQCWAGLYPETPDHHAVIGAMPDSPQLIHCAGFGGHGLMHCPAAGRAVAELIVTGECETFDLHPLRPTRFTEGDYVIETAVF